MLRVITAVLLISLAACITPAPPKPAMVALGTGGGDFGYASKDLGSELIEVTYRGDAVSVSASNPRDDSRTKTEEEKVAGDCGERAEAAIKHYLATAPRAPPTMFDHLYARLPSAYAGQRKDVEDQSNA